MAYTRMAALILMLAASSALYMAHAQSEESFYEEAPAYAPSDEYSENIAGDSFDRVEPVSAPSNADISPLLPEAQENADAVSAPTAQKQHEPAPTPATNEEAYAPILKSLKNYASAAPSPSFRQPEEKSAPAPMPSKHAKASAPSLSAKASAPSVLPSAPRRSPPAPPSEPAEGPSAEGCGYHFAPVPAPANQEDISGNKSASSSLRASATACLVSVGAALAIAQVVLSTM